MSFTFDKFMNRIVREERQSQPTDPEQAGLNEDQRRQIDPNRQRIMGREHWQNRTRGSWGQR
jgi:hypothetical protein